jgi:hypothetical protein
MGYDNDKTNHDHLQITDQAYQDLYQSEFNDDSLLEKGGACAFNAYRVAKYLVAQGVPRERLQFLYMVAETPGGREIIFPNTATLRSEERQKALKKGKETEWGYHAAIITRDTKQVFDLSSDKSNWGLKLDRYMAKTFLDEHGRGNDLLRLVVTPLDVLDEQVEADEDFDFQNMIIRGQADGGGFSTIWILQNKPEAEWYIKD